MDINEISSSTYADIFNLPANTVDTTNKGSGTVFGGSGGNDIFNSTTDTTTVSSTTDTTTVASTTDTTTLASTTDTTTVSADIFGPDGKLKQPEKQKNVLKDISGYFEDRLKNKKFVALKEVDEQGNESLFIPKTPEEFDEVIDLQVNYQVQKKMKEMETSWYETKSPAWKAVAKYADMIDDPSALIPFLSGIKTIESVSEMDENTAEGAEGIVRARLESRGDTKEIVDAQVDSLKSANKLIDAAKAYKPIIINEERQALAQQQQYAQSQNQKWAKDIDDIEQAAIKSIESPIFGSKQKLTKEEKAIIYDMIALPSEQSQGYGIYAALDKLYDKRDNDSMEVLKQVALLLAKKDSFFTYIGASVADKTATDLARKLKIAEMASGSDNNNDDNDAKPVVTSNRFTRAPKFGGNVR